MLNPHHNLGTDSNAHCIDLESTSQGDKVFSQSYAPTGGRARNQTQIKGLWSSHLALQIQLWDYPPEVSDSEMVFPVHLSQLPPSAWGRCGWSPLQCDETNAPLGSCITLYTIYQRMPLEQEALRRPGESGTSKSKQGTDSAGSGYLQSLRRGASKE